MNVQDQKWYCLICFYPVGELDVASGNAIYVISNLLYVFGFYFLNVI